jgi:hypothetical protein
MPYSKVQFIAHNIFTGPKQVTRTTQTYLGLSTAALDIQERVKLVGKAIDTARTHAKTVQANDTLKIFMLPEFFFRGSTGAYSMDEVQTAVSSLQTLVKDKAKWEHWLFVFGTIVGKSFETKKAPLLSKQLVPKYVIDTSKPIEIYNYSLVQKGGFGDKPDAGPLAAHAVLKEFESGIDFIEAGNLDGGGIALERTRHLAPTNTTRSEVQNRGYDGMSAFQQDGLTFGLEICLDHLEGRLKNSTGVPSIDIQLVPSCGASIKASSVVARKGGYVFNSDGLNRTLSDVQKAGVVPPGIALEASVTLDAMGIRINEIFPKGAGKLSIYPAQPLP